VDDRLVLVSDVETIDGIHDRLCELTSDASHVIIVPSWSRSAYDRVVKIRWPWTRQEQAEQRSLISVSDPNFAAIFNVGPPNYSGVEVDEQTALGIAAFFRAVLLISGTLAQLPMRALAEPAPGQRERVKSFLDTPGGPDGPTAFEWKQTVLVHLILHGNAFLLHVRGGAGQIVSLVPAHPLCVRTEVARYWPDSNRPVVGGKLFTITMLDGSMETHDGSTLTHIPSMSTDGIVGLSLLTMARNSLGTAIAGDRAAANMFNNGALISGLVSPEGDDTEDDDAALINEALQRKVAGWENASGIRFVNRRLKFTPWTMSAEDAQFIESRAFQVEEISRWTGVPPHLLMQTDKQTSWGTGVAESNRGMGRTVLAPWAALIEQRLSRLLRGDRFVEFDFSGLERPSPEAEVDLLNKQVDGGLMTINEARAVRNLPPVEGGDIIRIKGVPLLAALEPAPEVTP